MTATTLIESALADAAANQPATIYIDPNVGGLAWQRWEKDYCQSGPIGCDAADYGDRFDSDSDYDANLADVISALIDAGYSVVS